jgi:uncharacterized membrane protein YtjA (UPF0391 family)
MLRGNLPSDIRATPQNPGLGECLPSRREPETALYPTLGFVPRGFGNLRANLPVIDNRGRASRAGLLMEDDMLYWALVFFIIAIVAAFFGFGGVATTAASIAQILFFVFLVVFLIALVMGVAGRRRPPI